MKRHPAAIALDKWLEGPEGKAGTEPTTLNAPAMQRQYLENRLKRAFNAGWVRRRETKTESPMIAALGDQDNAVATVGDFAGCLESGQYEFWIISPTGIALKDETPEDRWKTLTQNVAMMFERTGRKHSQAAMMLGDLLRFGEEKYGERYADVIDATREYMRIAIGTLKNWQWIAGKIEPSRRRENLTLAHHEAVAKLPADEQDEFLRLADNEGMSVKELKEAIREAHPSKERAPKAKTLCALDVTNPAAITDMLQIIANHLSNPDTEWLDDWRESTHAIEKGFRKHFRNSGHKG